MGLSEKIDVHAHMIPDFYKEALEEAGHTHPDGMPGIPVKISPKIDQQRGVVANKSASSPGRLKTIWNS